MIVNFFEEFIKVGTKRGGHRFLSDLAIPIDTNPVERLIRAIASYCRSCQYKHSREYIQSMCIIITVYATLSVNGIEDPANWLRTYSAKLYKHMFEDARYLANKANNSEDKTEENLIAGFDFERYAASIFSAI